MNSLSSMAPDTANVEAQPLVLVVDDESGIRHLIRRWLEHWGWRVREATSAPEAYAMMQEEPASILFCDLKMPGESGLWLVQQVQGNWPATAVVVAAGVHEIETVLECKHAGAVDYLLKPFGREILRQALRRAEQRLALPVCACESSHPLSA